MKKGIMNIVVLLTVLAVSSGCGTMNTQTTNTQRLASPHERPILSAAEAKAMIRVEVRALEPIPAEPAIVALSD